MRRFEDLVGCWGHHLTDDTDDFPRAVYYVSGTADQPMVKAIDRFDNEEFVISEVVWADGVLSFRSLMPSTGRTGLNRFMVEDGHVLSEFTFTVRETLRSVDP